MGLERKQAERAALCAALGIAPAPERARALDADLDWNRLAERARVSMVLPTLARASRGLPVPPSVRTTLEEALVQNGAQNRLLLYDLAGVSRLLSARGIETIAIKGASLLARYPRYALLRHTDDIDLWVRPGRAEEAFGVLIDAGFKRLERAEPPPVLRYDGTPQRHQPDEAHQMPALASPRGTPVELHRFLPARRAVKWEDALRASLRVALEGTSLYVRDDSSTLVDLAAHVVGHHWALPALWPRHLMDLETLLRASPGLMRHVLARNPSDRAPVLLSFAVLAEVRRRVEGGVLARRLVFPADAPIGWGWFRFSQQAAYMLRRDPRGLVRAAWPSPVFLRSRGFLCDGEGEWRARLRHLKSVLVRASEAA